MANSKVQLADGTVLLDISQDTVSADKMLSGTTAHDKSGAAVTGNIPEKTSSDVRVDGRQITIPAGHYANQVSKIVSYGSATTPDTSLSVAGALSISVSDAGVITAAINTSKNIVPTVVPGYVTIGTGGTVSASGSVQQNLSTQAAKTVTPSRQEQTAVAAQKFTTGVVKVAPIPSNYYTLAEIYTVGSMWATTDGTAQPATVLGFGTWKKVAPAPMTWNDLKNVTWNNISGVTNGIYVWQRIA